MECTQRLECFTQELYESRHEKRTCSEQIGFLGICGTKYPIIRGPNKIGRDPQTCNIVLDLNSVSRQHAVINVLNSKEYMIMDLDSANKTKLLNKILQPYIPHPLKNGDTVQFGQIFGIFRLLEDDDDDLPMTQALDIPDTPVLNRHVTKLNNLPSTTIPESPDCSDKDESFIVSSQAKNQDVFKSPNSHFTKKIAKTIAIQPVGENKIDNAYWKSTKKSVSIDMSLDDSNEYFVDTAKPLPTVETDINEDIHEMDTQVPYPADRYETHNAIHTADTQLSMDGPSMSGLDTLSTKMNRLPDIQKTLEQQELKLNLFTENKENNNSIYNAETQQFDNSNTKKICNNEIAKESNEGTSNLNLRANISDEEIIFDEVDNQPLPDNFESQPLLPENLNFDDDIEEKMDTKTNTEIIFNNKISLNGTGINSDNSTDCDDFEFLPTQKIPEAKEEIKSASKSSKNDGKLVIINDDSTDCEDIIETDTKADPIKCTRVIVDDNDSTDCEDDLIPCNSNVLTKQDTKYGVFEDLPTQVIPSEKPNFMDKTKDIPELDCDFEDMATQVIEKVDIKNTSKRSDDCFEDLPTQVLSVETPKKNIKQNNIPADNLQFKVPLPSVKKSKKKEIIKQDLASSTKLELEDDNFYNTTQEIFDDLCTQNELSIENNKPNARNCDLESKTKEAISKNTTVPAFIGVDKQKNQNPTGTTSDSSDLEFTPKKSIRFMETDLPNSQEIKKSVSLKTARSFVESSSESEPDEVEEFTSVVSRKINTHKSTKIDLTKKFDTDTIPTRLLTRVRKPTAKAQNSNIDINKIMRSRLVTGSDENTDTEIIMENMLRLKAKINKHKDNEVKKSNETKNEDKQKQELELPKTVLQLPDPINNKNSEEKTNSKRKSDEKGKRSNEKSEENNDKKRNKTNRLDNDKKTSEIQTRSDKKLIDLSKEDKINHKKKEEIRKSDKISEKQSRRSPRTAANAQGDNKEGKKELSKSKSSDKLVKNQTNNHDKDSNAKPSNKEQKKELSESKSSNKRVRNQKQETNDQDSHPKPTRSTRSRQKETNKKEETKSSAKEKNESEKGEKRKRNTDSVIETSDKEMRRSKRQKTITSYLETSPVRNSKQSTSSRTSKHEQSTIYNISAESSNEKSLQENSVKRTAKDDGINVKTRSASNTSNVTSSRATPRNIKTHKVLFTAFPCEEVKEKLMQLGAIVVEDLAECTVLLTLQIKRTFKLLCAIGLGRPIVGPTWVQACVDTNMVVDPWLYIIKDEASEKRFQFNLERTLTGRRNFLQGYNVSSTPSIVPKPSEMRLIVESSGGTWKEGGAKWLIITCSSDKTLWLSLKRKGAILVSTELILEGVLQQKLNIEKHRLS